MYRKLCILLGKYDLRINDTLWDNIYTWLLESVFIILFLRVNILQVFFSKYWSSVDMFRSKYEDEAKYKLRHVDMLAAVDGVMME